MPKRERVNLHFLKRFSAESRNGQLFEWAKTQYENWDDILIATAYDLFWVLRLAAKGSSPGEIASAKKSALASIAIRMDILIGDLPDSFFDAVPAPVFKTEAIASAAPVVPVVAERQIPDEDDDEDLKFEDEETI